MSRRFIALSIVGGIAALGYVGAHQVGRWLDEPTGRVPETAPLEYDTDPPEATDHRRTRRPRSGHSSADQEELLFV